MRIYAKNPFLPSDWQFHGSPSPEKMRFSKKNNYYVVKHILKINIIKIFSFLCKKWVIQRNDRVFSLFLNYVV